MTAGGLVERERGADHRGEVGRKTGKLELALAPGMAEPVAARHVAGDECECAARPARARRFAEHRPALASAAIIRPFQSASTLSSRPGRTRLVARGEQFGAQRREPRLDRPRRARQRLEPVEDGVAFEISRRRHVVMPGKEFAVLGAERSDHFVIRPDVEFAFLAFGVGVERSRERALRASSSRA